MYAIIETGGKQYKVEANQRIEVEKLDLEVGATVDFKVLMTVDGTKVKAGSPYVKGVVATAEVVNHGKGAKITVYKYKPKKRVRKKQGHRQPFTTLKITGIK